MNESMGRNNLSKREELLCVLSSNFNLPTTFQGQLEEDSAFLREVKMRLTAVLEKMVQGDIHRLMEVMYRIDVPEQKVTEAFELGLPFRIAEKIADLVIERQMQKIHYRFGFSGD